MILDIVKVITPALFAFWIGIFLTPFLTAFLFKHKMWKARAGKVDSQGNSTTVFNKLHKTREVGTPRLGGVIIWSSSLVTIGALWLLAHISGNETIQKLDFLSRSQTWIPLSTLLIGAGIGLIDDMLEIHGSRSSRKAGGLSLPLRLFAIGSVGLLCGTWFFVKLGVVTIGIPFIGSLYIGWLLIPLFAIVLIALYSGGVIDGIDGLAGGVFASIFMAYAGIAFYQDQINLAAFSAMITGSILAFLWFNIPPARFYMSETGSMALTVTLGVIAFSVDSLAVDPDFINHPFSGGNGVMVLPIIAFPLVLTVGSNILQVFSKKIRGKKIFHVAPIHHHFEAIGWPPYKVTMRYWIISIIFALLGMIIAFIG